MNVVFWLLVIVGLVFLWFVLAFLFKPIGRFFYRLWHDAIKEMKDNGESKESKRD